MTWYPLRDAVKPFLGERLTTLFAHAVSAETDCLICSTFFRRLLIQSGEEPDGCARRAGGGGRRVRTRASRDTPHTVPARCTAASPPLHAREIVALTAFGAMMVATNVFNNALEVAARRIPRSVSGRKEDAKQGEFPGRSRSSPARRTDRGARRRWRWRARARDRGVRRGEALAYPGYGMGTRDDLEASAPRSGRLAVPANSPATCETTRRSRRGGTRR